MGGSGNPDGYNMYNNGSSLPEAALSAGKQMKQQHQRSFITTLKINKLNCIFLKNEQSIKVNMYDSIN